MALATYSITTPGYRPKGMKPRPTALVNRRHPLGANLVWCSVFHPDSAPFNAADGQRWGSARLSSARYTEIDPGPYNWRGPVLNIGDEALGAGTGIDWHFAPNHPFFKVAPVAGYTYAAIWKPTYFVAGTQRMMDCQANASNVLYTNPTTIGGGYVATTWRNAAGSVIDFTSSGTAVAFPTNPSCYVAMVSALGPASAPGGALYTNLLAGAQHNQMRLSFSDALADAAKTWSQAQTTFTPVSSGGIFDTGATSTRGRVYGQWIWSEQVVTADLVNMWYDDPWCMFDHIPGVEPASLMEMALAAGVTARPFAAGAGGWVH